MQQKKFDVDQAFKNLDTNKDNLIDQKDLEFFFQKNELTFDKHEQNFILFLFEPRLTGQISKEAFKIELSPIEKFDEVAQKVSILEDINEILREIVKVCREIETHKQNLNQHDFNMKELFLLLDINGGGILTKDDVYEGLKKLHIDISDSECRVLMREYCVDNDLEVMNFESFRQMFLPLNQIHSESSLKSSRITSNINKEDLKHIGAFFKNIVNSEKKAERFRQSLVEKKVDLMKVFKVLDSQNDGFLSGEDFIKFIIKSDISSNKNDINLLVSRFDKDKSNSISREEFVMELLPTPASYGDKGDDVELLKAILTEQIIRLRILEQRKIELIKRKNFRIYEIFNYLDENESGTLNNVELRSGFIDVFGIKTTWEEINMIIYKYSRYKDELVMELQDFQQIFIPIIADYKNLEAFSKPVGKMKIKKNIDESLIDLTEQYFKYLITYESFMRMMRNELQKKGDLKKLFSLLNTKRTAQITWQNFKEFAIKYDISHTEDDIQILFSIYDITKNGKISEQEFIKELIPRDLSNLFKKKLENFDYLKVIILEMKRILRDVEKWRETLAGQTDFKLFNLYNMFDLNDSHQISKEEVFRFFKKHGILANERLIELVMHKYSFDNNDLMSWAEFCLMMMPTSKNKNMEKLLDTNKYGYVIIFL